MAYSVDGGGAQWMIEAEDGELTRELRQHGIDMVANRETRLTAAAELQRTTGRPYYTVPIRQMNMPGAAYLQRTSATSLPDPSRCKVFRELTDEDLRDGLRDAGSPVGPVTHTTRKVYIDRFRKRYPQKKVVQSSCCTQSVTLNANPVLPPIGDNLHAHQQLVPIPDLLAELNAATPPSPSPPPPHPGENQGRPMQLGGNNPGHFSPPILNLPAGRGGANAESTPSRPRPHVPPQVGPLSLREAPLTGTPPPQAPSTAQVQPHSPPAVDKCDKATSTSSLDSAAVASANSVTDCGVQCSLAAVHISEGGAWRGGEPTSTQTNEQLGAATSNGTVERTAECGANSSSDASKEEQADKKDSFVSSTKCKEGKERQSANDLPTPSTQSSPLQQRLSQFCRLSTSGTHVASDVCFILQNGDTLFASRGFLAAVCPQLLPFLYNSEAPFPVVVNAFNGPSYTVWTRVNETIADIKLKLAMQMGVPAEQQRLVFQGKDLEETQTIADSGVAQHATLHLVLRHAPPAGRVAVQLVGEAAHSTLSFQRLSLCIAGGHDVLLSSLQLPARRPQATPTAQQATPTSHQSMPSQGSLPPPVEVVLPLHISHVVLCEGIGTRALEQAISFLYTGSVDISEDVAVQLCILAEKFQISELTELTLPIVRRTLHQDSLLLPLLVSFSEHLLRLQSVCLDFLLLPGNENALQHVSTMMAGDPEMLQQVQCAVELAKEDY